MTDTTRLVVLARRPDGAPRPDDFRIETRPLPPLGESMVLVAARFIPVSPALRTRLDGNASFAPPLAPDDPIEGNGVGIVLASRSPDFAAGDWVSGNLGWREAHALPAAALRKLNVSRLAPELYAGILGSAGLTAYFGLTAYGDVKPNETVLISSAAGGVGSAAGQIAGILGARAIGIAGGAEKCAWLTGDLGFAGAIDHTREADLTAAIRGLCPDGIDIMFDNVGNALIDAVLPCMRMNGRVLLCGQVGDYNLAPGMRHGITQTGFVITRRLRLLGVASHAHHGEYDKAITQLGDWILQGRLKHREDMRDGLEALPTAFADLFAHSNRIGRIIARIH